MRDDQGRLRLFMTHRAALIDYAAPIVGCRLRAEDVVQEAYLRFAPPEEGQAPARKPAPKVEQPVGYLYRIVRNLALDWSRRRQAETRRDAARRLTLEPLPTAPSPEEQAEHRDALRRVEAALAELPEPMRLAFEMNRLGGYTFEEIAARLQVSVATAGRWAQQALCHVARSLEGADG